MPILERKQRPVNHQDDDADLVVEPVGEWVVDDQKKVVRRSRTNDIVRVRRLSSGPTPTIGVTIPSKVLTASGLEIGDRVYVLIEEDGRLIVERIARDVEVGKARDRSRLVPMNRREQRWIREELVERIRQLEMDVRELELSGNKKLARIRMGRADRVRWLVRKVGGPR